MRNNTIPGAIARERSSFVKNLETLTTAIGNPRKIDRDLWRQLNSSTSSLAIDQSDDVLSVFFGPSHGIDRTFRKEVERLARTLANPRIFPSRIEIEFSASPEGVFAAAEGIPEDYRQSSINWALGLSSAVGIAANFEANGSVFEPYTVLRPVQTVIRCSEANVDIGPNISDRGSVRASVSRSCASKRRRCGHERKSERMGHECVH